MFLSNHKMFKEKEGAVCAGAVSSEALLNRVLKAFMDAFGRRAFSISSIL